MALTYQESSDLMADVQFRGRIKVSLLGFAKYVFGEAPDVPAHNTRYRYAQGIYAQPDGVSMQLQPAVVMEDAVQAGGANISDSALQGVVESIIARVM